MFFVVVHDTESTSCGDDRTKGLVVDNDVSLFDLIFHWLLGTLRESNFYLHFVFVVIIVVVVDNTSDVQHDVVW